MSWLLKVLLLFCMLGAVTFANSISNSNLNTVEGNKLLSELGEEKGKRNELRYKLMVSHNETVKILQNENFNMTLYNKEVNKRRKELHPRISKSYDKSGKILQKLNRHDEALDKFRNALILSYTILDKNSLLSQDILKGAIRSLEKCKKEKYKLEYAEIIIEGVEYYHQPLLTLDEAENLLELVTETTKKKELLIKIEQLKKSDFSLLNVIIIFLLLLLLYYSKVYFSPLVQTIAKNPKQLLKLTPIELKKVKLDLQILLQWRDTLRLAKTTERKVNGALSFYTKPSIELFTELIELKDCEKKEPFYLLENIEIGLNLKSLLLLLTEDNLSTIKETYLTGERIFIVTHQAYQDEIAKFCHNKNNNLIAPTSSELTTLLLSQNPKEILAHILANCLTCRYLSPYQTKGAINLKNNFFGRSEIIREITTRTSSNYLLVGARALGKSSILKALERHYQEDSKIECYYVALYYSDILEELSEKLNIIDRPTSLDKIVSVIKSKKRKVVFLLDEADLFPQHESYIPISSTFRKLAEEGYAMFVFAGYWKLYQSATMDYHSPLRNFTELIHLGELEFEACAELMLKPMERLNITYEDQEAIVSNVIHRCGNRANLIAMVCDNILKELQSNIITKKDVERAFSRDAHNNIYQAIQGWQGLSSIKRENAINRLIVYLTFELTSFTLSDVVEHIKAKKVEFSIGEIEVSLQQLDLSYVLKKENNTYSYQVPMLKEFLLEEQELEMNLDEFIVGLKN